MGKHRFEALDGLRGVAAVCVVVFHAHTHLRLYNLMPHAYLAVDFFFTLSGFVVAHGFNRSLSDQSLGWIDFLSLRLRRLAPLNVLGALVGAAVVLTAAKWLPPELGLAHRPLWLLAGPLCASVLLLPFPLANGLVITPLNPPAWSLFFELLANMIYAAVARFLTEAVLLVVVVLLAAGLVAYALAVGTIDVAAPLPLLAANGMMRALFGFSVGLLLHRRWAAGRGFPGAPFWLLCLALILVFQIPGGPSKSRAVADLVSIVLVFPAIVWAGAHSAAAGPVLRRSGQMSFPLYAVHWLPIVAGSTWVDLTFHSKAINLTFLIVTMLVLIGVALTAGHWDERLRSKVSPRREKPLPAAA